jgi:hypothetical protein
MLPAIIIHPAKGDACKLRFAICIALQPPGSSPAMHFGRFFAQLLAAQGVIALQPSSAIHPETRLGSGIRQNSALAEAELWRAELWRVPLRK